MRRTFLALSLIPVLGGCSTLGTYIVRPTNYTHLPQGSHLASDRPVIATLSMDASRRLMITKLDTNFTCSEPPPDAATSILAEAALKGGAKTPAGLDANLDLSDKFSTTATLIAKRTAAVEFWRTTSFAYCQLLMNGLKLEAAQYLSTAEKISAQFAIAEKPSQ